jgi:uncharacterized membrane protein HdeD (DUF308 family)
MNSPLLHQLAKNWIWILLRGIVAILFGVLAIAWPGVTLITLVILYGVYALLDGVFALIAAVLGGTVVPRWWLVLVGLICLGAGIATLAYPGMTALLLLMFIGVAAIARGVFEIIGAIQLRKEIDNEWWLILDGALSVLFGLFVLIFPGAGALALIFVIGCYAILTGVMLVSFALRLRKHLPEHEPKGAAT